MNNPGEIDESLESGYNVRAARHDYDDVVNDWSRRSEVFRSAAGGRLDVAYGPAVRQRLDVFAASAGAPTLVYLHGGYWQRGDKSIYSFIAEPFVNRGINVVVMSYTLCPESTVPEITDEIRQGLSWLYRHGDKYDLARDRVNVTGHSAGGHLTAMMLATNWPARDPELPKDLVKTGIPISGLYALEPLRRTSINRAARIDEDAVRNCSPQYLQPVSTAPVLAVVGGVETDVFHEQANSFTRHWAKAGIRTERYVEPKVDHFDVVNRLADPDSGLFEKTLEWLV